MKKEYITPSIDIVELMPETLLTAPASLLTGSNIEGEEEIFGE